MTLNTGVDEADEAVRLAQAYLDTKNYQRARDIARGGLAERPNDPALLIQHARAEYALGNYADAARSAYAVLSVAPQDELAMRLYAHCLDGLGRRYDALVMAWRGVIAHPNEPLQYQTYARLLHNTRQSQLALQMIDEALRLGPDSADALVLRGSILHDLKRLMESDASYRAALQLDPGNAEALNNIAVNRLQRGKLTRALRGFLSAAGSDPTMGDLARWNIGVVLRRVLSVVTLVATGLSVLVAVTAGRHCEGHPTVTLRVLSGLGTVAVIAALTWLLRTVPRPVLVSVLRHQHFAALRVVHAALTVAAGAWAVGYPGPPVLVAAGGLLAVVGLVVMRVGMWIGR